MQKIDRDTMAMGSGAGIGVIQVILFKEYADTNWGLFPGIGQYLPVPWGNWSTLGNIIFGGITFGLSTFTSIISNKSPEANKFFQSYGIVTLVGGIMNGLFPRTAMRARAVQTAKPPVKLVPTDARTPTAKQVYA